MWHVSFLCFSQNKILFKLLRTFKKASRNCFSQSNKKHSHKAIRNIIKINIYIKFKTERSIHFSTVFGPLLRDNGERTSKVFVLIPRKILSVRKKRIARERQCSMRDRELRRGATIVEEAIEKEPNFLFHGSQSVRFF